MKNWPIKKLGEVALINPSKQEVLKLPLNTPISFVSMASINQTVGTISDIQTKKLSEVKNGYTYFANNDVLFAKITPCMENGKIAIAQNLQNGIGFGTTEVHILRSTDQILPEWIYFLLSRDQFREEAEKHMTGSAGQQRVPRKFLENVKIPVPPLNIQKKIVERLDSIRKAQELCVQQIQKTEELFDSIIGEFENKQIGLIFNLEDLLVEPLQNGVNFSKTQMGNGTLLVNVKDVYTENEIEEDKLNRISITEKEILNYSLHDGDVLFVRSSVKRDGVGFTAIFKSSSNEPIVYSGFIIKASVDTRKILPQYLLYVTRSKHLRKRIIESSGTGTITNINQGSINRLQILVPDLKTQQEIVEKLEAVQSYKKLLKKEKALHKELFDSVLNKSMKGELDN